MKPPDPEGTPRIDVSREELEALLEGVRPALGEVGYQKLQAAIRTLNYVTELLETCEATLERLRRLLCHSSTEKTEKVASVNLRDLSYLLFKVRAKKSRWHPKLSAMTRCCGASWPGSSTSFVCAGARERWNAI